jgi:hypothetical protein
MFDNIDMDQLGDKIKDLILAGAKKAIPGPEKMKLVIKEAAAWVASKITTPLGDGVEEWVARIALRGLAQFIYAQLKKQGQV